MPKEFCRSCACANGTTSTPNCTKCWQKWGQENETDASYDAIHLSLLTGLLGNIGQKDEEREYLKAGGRKFHLFPASALKKKPPQVLPPNWWKLTPVWAHPRKIQPEWVEKLASHLLRHHYTEPHWEQAGTSSG